MTGAAAMVPSLRPSSERHQPGWGRPPKVTVGLPVYNGERFLGETLDSLLAQTFGDFEIIAADNASTDGTRDICEAYQARDRRIRYVRNEVNVGFAENINRTVGLARAPYFKVATADDLCGPELLERCVGVLDGHPEVVLCYARATLIDEVGGALRPYDDDLDLREGRARDRFRAALDRMRLVNLLQGVMRTEVLRRTTLMGNYCGADGVLVVELALHGQIHETPERLLYRRMHGAAFSALEAFEDQQERVDPRTRGKAPLLGWRTNLGYVAAIRRAPVTPWERIVLLGMVVRRAVGAREKLARELAHAVTLGLRRRRRVSAPRT